MQGSQIGQDQAQAAEIETGSIERQGVAQVGEDGVKGRSIGRAFEIRPEKCSLARVNWLRQDDGSIGSDNSLDSPV
jgi:hypothetical protein